jgi:hypothetical protein
VPANGGPHGRDFAKLRGRNGGTTVATSTLVDVRTTESTVFSLEGPEALGPEAAGAITLLHTTLVDGESAERFHARARGLLETLGDASGLIRFVGFLDGTSLYGLGFWKTIEDAAAIAKNPGHRALVKELRDGARAHTQFSGIWAAHMLGPRVTCYTSNPRTNDRNRAP